MRIPMTMALIGAACLLAVPAQAGNTVLAGGPNTYQTHTQSHGQKYSLENGVKVYRNAPGPRQQAAIDRKRQILIRAEQIRRKQDQRAAEKRDARRRAKKAYNNGYNAGFRDATQAADARCNRCERRQIRLRQRVRTRPSVLPIVLRRRNLQ